ncbi:MAG: L,D-transpeptidase family protein [Verrucomicrobiota bacterium]
MHFTRFFLTLSLLVLAVAVPSASAEWQVPSIFLRLTPQRYTWYPGRSLTGPVIVFVSLPRQEAVVYRNGVRIGRAAVSTGREGHRTPTGVFQILEKDINHHSKTYNDAPMPYMERLTWDGVALHAGFNPGHPDSHGCVRLPAAFARELYGVTQKGGTVIISDEAKLPTMALSQGFGTTGPDGRVAPVWKGVSGGHPAAITISTSGQRMMVYQNGRLVGESPVDVRGPFRGFQGESVFVMAGDQQWHRASGTGSMEKLHEELVVPSGFARQLGTVMRPGTTMVITSERLNTRPGQSRGVLVAQ